MGHFVVGGAGNEAQVVAPCDWKKSHHLGVQNLRGCGGEQTLRKASKPSACAVGRRALRMFLVKLTFGRASKELRVGAAAAFLAGGTDAEEEEADEEDEDVGALTVVFL